MMLVKYQKEKEFDLFTMSDVTSDDVFLLDTLGASVYDIDEDGTEVWIKHKD